MSPLDSAPADRAPVSHAGGCLCGAIRFRAAGQPLQTTICHCTFCQRLTGSAFLVEPIFARPDVAFEGEAPKVYERRSDGSGLAVRVNFCGRCGTTLFLSFERWPDHLGICGGAFDDPNGLDRGRTRHIFTCEAQAGVALPAGVPVYVQHAVALDGTPNAARVLDKPMVVVR